MSENKIIKLVVIIAGELSGDNLGSGLMRELKIINPNISFFGVGGPKMISEGLKSIGDMETLSVMGIWEPLKKLPKLLNFKNVIIKKVLKLKPDVFIGIDSPDFNLPIEKKLRLSGIKTCHYVCPSIWAWRPGRIKNIKSSADHVLTLLPFEEDLLRTSGIEATFVGHPIADFKNLEYIDNLNLLQLDNTAEISNAFNSNNLICILPGSRSNEVEKIFNIFVEVIQILLSKDPNYFFLIPAASEKIYFFIEKYLSTVNENIKSRILVVMKKSIPCLSLSRFVITTSGTATLEAAVLGKPMVSCYKMSKLSYGIISRMVKTKYYSLPNLLTKKPYIPEFIQENANPSLISAAALEILNNAQLYDEIKFAFNEVREELSKNADKHAALIVSSLV